MSPRPSLATILRLSALAIAATLVLRGVTHAADAPAVPRHHHVKRADAMPPAVWDSVYPLSWRARKVRKADNCWRGCEAEAGRAFQSCLRIAPTNDCVQHNDTADRYCQWQCRLSGGPLLDLPY